MLCTGSAALSETRAITENNRKVTCVLKTNYIQGDPIPYS